MFSKGFVKFFVQKHQCEKQEYSIVKTAVKIAKPNMYVRVSKETKLCD